ncbi:MAG: hypothetical protein ACU0E9_12105 [Limimaricola soesokkakensis]|uniref:hypothetical protein n=1 Tax=Limimaricola soesokkakensis TaxID=1343159 RepID=UPI004057CD6E
MKRKSNLDIAREATGRLRALISECEAAGKTLPVMEGALWHAEIKRQVGLSNSQIDGNDAIRKMLSAHAEKHGVMFSRFSKVASEECSLRTFPETTGMVPASRLREVQLELARAERKNIELRAEIVFLRAQVMRVDEVTKLIAMGGRMTPGTE